MSGDAAALALHSVTAGYRKSTVLRDINLTVPRGQIVALMGPNGAGKTTLLRVAAGLLPAGAGRVEVGGVEVTTKAPHQRVRAGVCLIPEGRGVFASLSVRDNLRLQIPPWSKERSIESALDAFPVLRDKLGQAAGRLSGGQQQMLALSRCLLAQPEVVLLDEVSMGLAPRVIDEIFEALRRIAATGVSLLLVEQYVSRALEIADHVYLLNRGSIGFTGPPADLDEDELMRRYVGVEAHPSEGESPRDGITFTKEKKGL